MLKIKERIKKIIKIEITIILLIALMMTNFMYVGVGLISYAEDSVSTNTQNIEFGAQIKDGKLNLEISVKKDGYFNGTIELSNSNFKLKSSDSKYINQLEDKKITLNQINAGTTAVINIEIAPEQSEVFNVNLLNITSKLQLDGTYKNSSEKEISVKATREIDYRYTANTTQENVENTAQIITNKIANVSGEEKRIIEISMNMGLKDNSYPIKNIETKIAIPQIDGKSPKVVKKVNFNTMTHYDYQYDGKEATFTFTNEPNENNLILWKKTGTENIVLTLIYDKDAQIDGNNIIVNQKIRVYDSESDIETSNQVQLDNEEKDGIINVTTSNTEGTIYKGKLNSKLDRQMETKTLVAVNFSGVVNYLNISEQPEALKTDTETNQINTVYNKTTISKSSFDEILGENGTITVTNQKGEVIGVINRATPIDNDKNIVLDYAGNEPETITIKTSKPVAEGNLEFTHLKTIKFVDTKDEVIKNAKKIETKVNYEYGENTEKEVTAETELIEAKTEVALEVNKETLSTEVTNNVELRAKFTGNSEKYNLLNNPTIGIELPEDVEEVKVNAVDLVYESELKIKNYYMKNKTLMIELEEKQTAYKEAGIEGTIVVVNIDISLNKKTATKDSIIKLGCNNNNEIVTSGKQIKIVASKDITVINNISELGVETSGQNEVKQVTIKPGENARQYQTEIEIINNNENQIKNVKVLGTFVTNSDSNNMNAKISEGITLSNAENAKIYYSENENATDDIEDTSNRWTAEIKDVSKVKRYLIIVSKMESQESIKGIYKTIIPANLENNQIAKQGYVVKYTNELTNVEKTVKSTTIELQTGVDVKLETKLEMQVSGVTQEQNAKVKNGEVIKYKIQVINSGNKNLNNITISGAVPDGTVLVKPTNDYEYAGEKYYDEIEDVKYEQNINNLQSGQVVTLEYEVRVKNDTKEGTNITNKIETTYGGKIKTSNETNLVTEKGDLRVTVKRVTDRSIDIYEYGAIVYYAIVENISNEIQNNVIVKENLPKEVEVEKLEILTVTEDESSTFSSMDYSENVNVGSLNVGETKILCYYLIVGKSGNEINFSATAKLGDNEYRSNNIEDNVKVADISAEMTSNIDGQYVKTGDTVEYTIKIKNNAENSLKNLSLEDTIPSSLSVEKVIIDGEENDELKGENKLIISLDTKEKSESLIKIITVVNYSEARDEAETITNSASVKFTGKEIAKTAEITYIILANDDNNGNNGGNNGQDNKVNNSDIATGNKAISGIAWYDENSDGKKDDNEKTLSGIKVHLLNTQTNNLVKDKNRNILEATTNENGLYILNNIGNGKYIVVFDYDQTKYSLTKYKAEQVDESRNSNVLMKEIEINSNKQPRPSTDIIEVVNNNISNINIGLTQLQEFDLQLEKYVSKIVIRNKTGTIVKEYDNATVAKAEIDAKKINGTTVIIEYKIRVTNAGKVPGYVRKIADYMPNDLKFSSELNKDWYQTGDTLYNAGLANEKINAGESKEVTLTLTKSMTENNTGRTNNTAEIAEAYNDLGLSDVNSTPGNKRQGENDMGSADVIISIKTGGIVYVSIAVAVVTVLAGAAFIIIKIKNKKENM